MKIGTTELIIVLIVVVIIFGPTQIPKLTRMFGKSIKEFRNAVSGSDESEDDASVNASASSAADASVNASASSAADAARVSETKTKDE